MHEQDNEFILVLGPHFKPDLHLATVEPLLESGRVMSVLVSEQTPEYMLYLDRLRDIVHAAGRPLLIENSIDIAKEFKLDGVHITSGIDDVEEAIEALRPNSIVGVGHLSTRHEAMLAAEMDIDYISFGRISEMAEKEIHQGAFELATWANELMTLPVIFMMAHLSDTMHTALKSSVEIFGLEALLWQTSDPVSTFQSLIDKSN